MSNRPLPHFTTRLAFMLVTAGAAVGLGNVWGFTYVAGKNGGGGFVLIYLLAMAFVALPVFMAELLLGRLGQASPPTALARLGRGAGSRLPWGLPGWVGLVATILILSFYTVIAGQALYYTLLAPFGTFAGVDDAAIAALDRDFKSGAGQPLLWGGLFMALTGLVVSADIRSGLERTGKWLMPVLFVMLLAMVIYAALIGDFPAALDFLFGFHRLDFSPRLLLEAVGQAFFSLSVGVGGIMMYGAYMGDDVRLPRAVLWIVLMDVGVALLAGLAIFPLVFASSVDPAAGPGLVFQTLPMIFADLPMGSLAAFVFFLLLTFAAITSAMSILAPSVARLEEAGWPRRRAAWLMTGITFALSSLTALSLSDWRGVYPLAFLGLDGMTFFALIREGVNNVVLPLGGLSFALMAGFGLSRSRVLAGLPMRDGSLFRVWYACLRWLVPVAVGALFLTAFLGH
ncbi:sodium-dependent transporter [Yunchengibacter salinarum]|uniref:sodium-dependent transporter n=1 Tax=Yunchengibacter salinarum TaxID=3133399 RepID=UPI0035B67352